MSESVFLNLNTNFSNDTASNYSQYFDNPLEIPANAEVALYNAELKKAPINLSSDQNVTLFIDSATNNTAAFTLHNTDASLVDNNDLNNLTFTLKKGSYSKRAFLDHLQTKAKAAIKDNNDDTSKPRIPYKFCVYNDTDKIFAGLAPDFKTTDFVKIGFEPGFRNKNMEFESASNVATATRFYVEDGTNLTNPGGGVFEAPAWAMSQSAVNPLVFGRNESGKVAQLQGHLFFNMFDNDLENTAQTNIGCCFLRTSDVRSEKSGNNNLGCVATSDGLAQVPKSFFGFQIIERYDRGGTITPSDDLQSQLVVYGSYYGDSVPDTNLQAMVKLFECSINSLNNNQRFGVSIYYENEENPADLTKNKYYFRVHNQLQSADYTTTPELLNNVIFDSKSVDYQLSQSLISQCFKYEDLGGGSEFYSGFVPTFYAFCETGRSRTAGADQIGWADISGNFIYDSTQDTVTNRDTIGLLKYSMTDLGDDIKGVFGNNEVKAIAPTGWDRVSTPDFGLTELFGDTTNYNIEISNLPIQSNQSTETVNNNIGTKRPIVFQVNNAFSGSLNQVNSGELIRSIYPPQLKFLKLNNVKPLKLNSLNVKIKRSKDNSVASELNDCKLELLIK
jgi:hypothetical protein